MTNNVVLVVVAVAALLAGTVLSIQSHNFQWLGRFGALVICVGIIALARPSIAGQQLRPDVIMESGFSQLDYHHYFAVGELLPDWFAEERRAQGRSRLARPFALPNRYNNKRFCRPSDKTLLA
jgi:hypothetical protein